MTEELLPCPFCGAPAEASALVEGKVWRVGCSERMLNHDAASFSWLCAGDAADRWNRRSALSQPRTENLGPFESRFDQWAAWQMMTDGITTREMDLMRRAWSAALSQPQASKPVAWRYGASLFHSFEDAYEYMRYANDSYAIDPLYLAAAPQPDTLPSDLDAAIRLSAEQEPAKVEVQVAAWHDTDQSHWPVIWTRDRPAEPGNWKPCFYREVSAEQEKL